MRCPSDRVTEGRLGLSGPSPQAPFFKTTYPFPIFLLADSTVLSRLPIPSLCLVRSSSGKMSFLASVFGLTVTPPIFGGAGIPLGLFFLLGACPRSASFLIRLSWRCRLTLSFSLRVDPIPFRSSWPQDCTPSCESAPSFFQRP